jgi:sec-independent protein translocase protein TatB
MFNIGTGEIALIAVVALLLLGPERLPELARGIGKFMREFRRQTDDVRNVVEREFYRMDEDIKREDAPRIAPPTDTVSSAKFVPPNKQSATLPAPTQDGTPGAPVPPAAASATTPASAMPATPAPPAADEKLPEPEPFKSQVTGGTPEEKK